MDEQVIGSSEELAEVLKFGLSDLINATNSEQESITKEKDLKQFDLIIGQPNLPAPPPTLNESIYVYGGVDYSKVRRVLLK